ncbi:hypothetical protein DENSPDRAFT_879946 [Dentipellis sp. KUC8613]|nr:hypothetical protein DENSPDRAFT_879946 [Dentipellis sp. KUC8613]
MRSIFLTALFSLLTLGVHAASFVQGTYPSTSLFSSTELTNYRTTGRSPNPERCPNAQVHNTTYVPVGAHNVTIATFACDHSSTTKRASSVGRGVSKRGETLAARDQSECTSPTGCFCGQACVATCTDLTSEAPTVANCQVISQAMEILGTNNAIGQTFFVDPDFSVLIFFSDCEYEWDNISDETIEYCWDDFANVENALQNSCLQGANNGGTCLSVTNDWQLS